MVDLTPFKSGIDAALAAKMSYCSDPRSALLSVLQAAGLKPKTLLIDRIDRIDGPEDKAGRKSGWYIYREFPAGEGVIGVADYGCWKTGLKAHWVSRADHTMSMAERLAYHAAREAMKLAQEAETLARHNETAVKAAEIYAQAGPCAAHGYLTRKQIKPIHGLKIGQDGRLIVPLFIDGHIASLQMISDDGQKRFLTGGRTKGAWFKIEVDNQTIYVAEGLATAASIYEATGNTIFVAFSSHNLYETATYARKAHPDAQIIVAGDNGNGSAQAEQAAEAVNGAAVFPPVHKDFNDFHCAAGIEAVKQFLRPANNPYVMPAVKENNINVIKPDGVIADIYNYYNATSGNDQSGFALQTALAVCSVVLGRSYCSNLENFTSLYFLNVGKSGTGKEHPKTVIERILNAANMGYLISGDGYTSAGAVFSALLDKPRHIAIIDEFGRYLEAGRDMGKGNHHQREANTKLMESIGRAHGFMRPPTYSTMTLKKEQADAVKNRQVQNPAITLLTMTTPDTLFKTLDMGAIRDGFINRFIICMSDAQRSIRKHKPAVDVPQSIIDWIRAVTERHGKPHIANDPAAAIVLTFTQDALDAQNEFQQYCIDKADYLERFGMSELPMRSNEMAMRLALIVALSENHDATEIRVNHMQWGIAYIRQALEKTIDKLKISISSSGFEAAK